MEIININDIPDEGTTSYELKCLFERDGIKYQYVSILPGARVPETGARAHEYDEYCYYVSGEIICGCEGQEVLIKKGDISFIKKHVPHWSRNDSNKPCAILCIFLL